ncbi:MAG: hypothetical protein PUP92_38075 [Rhizonema sp. PD38]|nr:hypothetical protein [Rhizonema sp. PD38]
MDKNCFTYGIEISDSDWEGTPASVRQLVEKMGQHIKQSEKELADLEAQRLEQKRKNQSHIKELIISSVLRSTQC